MSAPDPPNPIPLNLAVRNTGLELVGSPEVAGCWSEMGVYGRSTCPELTKFVHCRNCPVYSSAGAELLHRALPPGYRREATEHFAAIKTNRQPATCSAILFRLHSEWLALPTRVLQEIAERRQIHSLPHHQNGVVLGLTNIRGELTICVSLGHLLGFESSRARQGSRTFYHRLLVVTGQAGRLAFPVDEVHGPERFDLQELKSPPLSLIRSEPAYIQGLLQWQQKSVSLLEIDLVFRTLTRSLT